MRKLTALLVALLTGLLIGAPVAHAMAAPTLSVGRGAAADAVLFAGGGTQLSNGYFFPGTAVYQDDEYTGVPLQVAQGSNVQFVNLDHFIVAGGGHKVISYDRIKKNGRKIPLFSSPMVDGPGQALIQTAHVKPGVYPFFCPIHNGMIGQIEVK